MPSSRITPCAEPRCRQGIWDSSGNHGRSSINGQILMEGLKKNQHSGNQIMSYIESGLWQVKRSSSLEDFWVDSNGSAEASTQPSFNHQWRHRSSKFLSFRGLEIPLECSKPLVVDDKKEGFFYSIYWGLS